MLFSLANFTWRSNETLTPKSPVSICLRKATPEDKTGRSGTPASKGLMPTFFATHELFAVLRQQARELGVRQLNFLQSLNPDKDLELARMDNLFRRRA